jgi:hypothetical protein
MLTKGLASLRAGNVAAKAFNNLLKGEGGAELFTQTTTRWMDGLAAGDHAMPVVTSRGLQ